MLLDLLVRDVTIQTATALTDRYNNETLDWTSPSSSTVKGWVSQTATSENLEQRDALSDTLIVTLPPEAVIGGWNRVVLDGRTYEVDGEPNPCWTPRGLHHWEVPLRAVTG